MMYKFFFVILLLLFSGCSVVNGTSDWFSSKSNGNKESKIEKAEKNPVEVDISQAYYSGETLNLKVYVRALTEVPTSEIVVAAIGLSEGTIVEQHIKKLSDFYSGEFVKKDQKIALSFQLGNKKLSEYQVNCSWGNEAKQLLAQTAVPTLDPGVNNIRARIDGEVSLREVELIKHPIKCPAEPCDIMYSINSKVVNGTNSSIEDIKLALGIFWVDETKKMSAPSGGQELLDGEEVVSLEKLHLGSGEAKSLRISVDRPIPVVPGGDFFPYLRILSYSAK
jgi:hypothetical protein